MWGAGMVLEARRGAELLPTKAKPTRSDTHALPFPEGAARERYPLCLSGSRDGVRHCRAVPGGSGGRAKCLRRVPRGSEGYVSEK